MIGIIFFSPAWAQPLEVPPARYLEDAEIRTALLEPDWQSCVGEGTEDLTAPVSFRILPTGTVEVLTVEAPEPLAACWSDLLTALQFRKHDEEPLLIRWTLGVHDESTVPYPTFQPVRRQLHPFFLFIPPDASTGAIEVLLETLEVSD